jgi:ankyrin repeat protein
VSIVRWLLELHPELLNTKNELGENALQLAIKRKMEDLVDFLSERNIEFIKDKDGMILNRD